MSEAVGYPSWELLLCEGEVPQSRSGHTCALYCNRFLYVFGGFDGSNCFDDLYVLDLDSRQWRQIKAGGECPSGRASHSAVTDELAGVMYVFGGSGSHFGYTNKHDLCEFNFETESWRLLSNPVEDTPSARYGQSMVTYQEGLYVWGGTHGTNYPTDMHRFDLCSKQWEFVVSSGELPCGRYRHQAMVKDDVMYVVGGSGINRYGDVFAFHFDSSSWSKLVCTGTDLSDGRFAHSAVLKDGNIYLYGGNDGVRHDDLQQLDLETKVWSRVTVYGQCPPGRDFHAAVLRKDSMVIFGGSSGTRRHNDVFEFHLKPKVPMDTLAADLDGLLEQVQADEKMHCLCDAVLTAENSTGIYCHLPLLRVRCPRLHAHARAHIDSLAQQELYGAQASEISDDASTADPSSPSRPSRSFASGTPPRVPVDMPYTILWHFVKYLYSESTKFGLLSPEQLYQLFIASVHYEVPRLGVFCERQLKVRLSLDNVLSLLRASAKDGAAGASIHEACKLFFLSNYNQCIDMKECEDLDPRLLCDLMRLHNTRMTSSSPTATCKAATGSSGVSSLSMQVGWAMEEGNGLSTPLPRPTLAADLQRLLTEETSYDFEVVVQDEVIYAHKFVLVARSGYFASCILTSGMVEAQAGRLVIPPSSAMTSRAFRALLRFMYSGDDILSMLEPHTAMYLIEAPSFYDLTNCRLKYFCELCVRDAFNKEHVLQLFEAASRLGVEAIRSEALDFIIANYPSVACMPGLEQLDKTLLVDILKGLAERWPPAVAPAPAPVVAPQSLG